MEYNLSGSCPGLVPHVLSPAASNPGSSAAATEQSTIATSPEATSPLPLKKKQKRNKPTLSCEECVERKTKCDRGRPHCLACIKRQTRCKYECVASLLEETKKPEILARRMTKPPQKKPVSSSNPSLQKKASIYGGRDVSSGPTPSPAALLPIGSHAQSSASNVFGIGSEHPFANYWTCQGGLPEVISVFPEKFQADILLDRYFECVDPVYPMIHRQTFYADYEHFWSLSQHDKSNVDASLVALIFTMLALGTQFTATASPKDGQQTAEFYVSAAHQSLRIGSYLNKASVRSIQAMVLVTYFLINDNHAYDGWAFAGILMRQAYAMLLHRDPNVVTPNASVFEKQVRRKLWQAVLLQDTFLTVLLSLPPSATHTDVNVDDLIDDSSSIAHSAPTDIAYIRGCWILANLVQESVCSPRSLDLPICTTMRQKAKLIADFRAVHRSLPDIFRSWDVSSITLLARENPRVVKQILFLTSNYYHNVMLLHASKSAEVPINKRASLEAAHEAIQAFFLLYAIFEAEARVWWVFNHRAYLEAACVGSLLRIPDADDDATNIDERLPITDPLYVRAKADIARMVEILYIMSKMEHGSDVAMTRISVLNEYL